MFSEEQLKGEEEEVEALAGKDEEERRIAEMGRPMLGDHVKLEIIIEESYEFKVRRGSVFVWLCGQIVKDDRRLNSLAKKTGAPFTFLFYFISKHVSILMALQNIYS